MRATEPRTLVLGLGNPLLGDDGVGWRIVEAVQQEGGIAPGCPTPEVELDWHAGGGLALMERMIGYQRAIIVDAMQSERGPVGSVHCCAMEDLPQTAAGHLVSAHETSLATALAVGRRLGADLPEAVVIVAVEARPVLEFSEQLSPDVAAAVPIAASRVRRLLEELAP